MIMTDTQNMMVTLTEKFLDEHFPNDPHSIRPVGSEFAVDVGVERNFKLSFRLLSNSVYNVVIHEEHFDAIAPLFGLNEFQPESTNILNDFIQSLNKNEAFNQVFNPVPMVDFSKHMTTYSKFEDTYKDIYDADERVSLITKTGSVKRQGIAQFAFRFTKTNKLKCLPAIALFYGEMAYYRIGVGFDLDNQTVHSITETVDIYEDFFVSNKAFNFETEINAFVVNFLNDWITCFHKDRPEEQFIPDDVSFKDKLELFKMSAI